MEVTLTIEPLARASSPAGPGQQDRGEDVDLEHPQPVGEFRRQRPEPLTLGPFGEMPALFTSAWSTPPSAARRPRTSSTARTVWGGASREVDLQVVLRAHLPGAILGKRLPRAGDDPPAGGRESLHGRVADAPARAREQHDASAFVEGEGHGPSLAVARGSRCGTGSAAAPQRLGGRAREIQRGRRFGSLRTPARTPTRPRAGHRLSPSRPAVATERAHEDDHDATEPGTGSDEPAQARLLAHLAGAATAR